MSFLRTEQLSYRYPGSNFLLDDICLSVPEASTFGILGKNGSGKSTLLRLIGGHLFPDSGRLFLGKEEITLNPAKDRQIVTVFQTLALFPHLSVRENIAFPLAYQGKRSEAEKEAELNAILDTFHLTDLQNRPSTKLSLGQQQRVAVARALATGADVLLLDEPTASLDYATKDQLVDIIEKLQKEQLVKAIVIVSHDRDFILKTCTHLGLIEEGRLVYQNNIKDIYTQNPPEAIRLALDLPHH